jgi:uncharacterized protein (DUF488 family)
MEIHTIGHSTHDIDAFLALLRQHRIGAIADVRRYPGSRRNPQFNAAALAAALGAHGIALEQLGDTLGGRRRPRAESPNGGWRVEGFRAYADHMATDAFAAGMRELETLAGAQRAAVMCAESDWRRCHRRLIADALRARGWRVLHVLADGRVEEHQTTPFAVVEGDLITYPPASGALA